MELLPLRLLNPETWSRNTRPEVINYIDLSNIKWGRIEAVAAYPQKMRQAEVSACCVHVTPSLASQTG